MLTAQLVSLVRPCLSLRPEIIHGSALQEGDGPIVKCHYSTHHTCTIHPDCEWCTIGDTKVTGACYTHEQAEYLPEKMYHCKKLLADGVLDAEEVCTCAVRGQKLVT